ncbi:MAG TPA: sigma-54 dependent transcriptional regulator [Pirellulaceae bacterium]|nr:sigma-54 dependent transcriptional regulator [Pirellulaceae bacterium]
MSKHRGWVLADDESAARALALELSARLATPLTGFSLAEWQEDRLPRGCPQAVFIDLRSAALWSKLSELRQNWKRLQGQPVPFIGVIEQGLPAAGVVLAEQYLAGTFNTLQPSDDWAQLLSDATARERVRQAEQAGGFRLLHAGGLKFLTYTPALFPLLDDLQLAAQCDFTVLLVGETGTGKTTLARMIHDLSLRRERRFLTVACGSLPNELIDSELFGHVRGAFTGADKSKQGKFEISGAGTILLDEIDVLGTSQQAKLLRVLETGEYEPLGCNETRVTNARTVAASNLCLEMLVHQERFRADLFYRLNQVKFEVPPLRQRPLDILPLAMDAMEECCREHNLPPRRIHRDFIETLKRYSWPGNIRELRNEVRRSVLFARDGLVTPLSLSTSLLKEVDGQRQEGFSATLRNGLANEVAQTEQGMIESMLKSQNFNRAATARALGISRVTLYNKLRKYGIDVPANLGANRAGV